MQLMWHYLKIFSDLSRKADDSGFVSVTLPELAGMLYCSERNVKLIVRRMTDEGWIEWAPGSGRGNSSRLKLLRSADELVLEEAKAIAEKGRLAEALELMRVEEMSEAQRQRFMKWVSGYFGFSVESNDEGKRELDVLRLPVYKSFSSLDPAFSFYAFDSLMILQLYDTLLKYDNGEVVSNLAFAWEESADGTTWWFRLRKGVLFHNGEELTADHVRRSLLRIRQIGSMHRWLLDDVVSIEAAQRYKVVFRLRDRNVLFLQSLCASPLSIVWSDEKEEPALGSDRAATSPIVGTGPFRLTKQEEHELVIEANEQYFRGRPHLDRIDLWLLPETMESVVTEALDSPLVFQHDTPIDESEDVDGKTVQSVEQGISLLTFNLTRPGPLQDRKLRLAIDVCLDRERMAAELGGNRAGAARGLIVAEEPATLPDQSSILGLEERLLLARHFLSQTDYNGEVLRLFIYPRYEEDAEWVKQRLAEIGVRLEVVLRSLQLMPQIPVILEADMIIYGTIPDDPEELAYLGFFEMELSFVRTHMNDQMVEEVTRLGRQIRGEPDKARRFAMYRYLEQRLIAERYVLPLMRKSLSMAHDDKVKGATFNSLGWADLPNIWFD